MFKVVVVISGGLDSSTAAWLLATNRVSSGNEFYFISFDYGQKHKKELEYAKKFGQILDVKEHKIVDISSINQLFAQSGSSLVDGSTEVPSGHYAEKSMKATVVPNRNAIMLAIAWGYASSIGADRVVTAVHAGDHYIYPDCRPAFTQAISAAFRMGNEGMPGGDIRLITPFIKATKADIISLGAEAGMEFEWTWSCYNGGEKHCGTCGTCVERQEAFYIAGVDDPTEYEDPEYWKQVTANRLEGIGNGLVP